MIYGIVVGTVTQGKDDEAFDWSVKIADWINEKCPDSNVRVLQAVCVKTQKTQILATADSLGDMMEVLAALHISEEYHQMLTRCGSEGLFAVEGITEMSSTAKVAAAIG